jgi:hypothetical protein
MVCYTPPTLDDARAILDAYAGRNRRSSAKRASILICGGQNCALPTDAEQDQHLSPKLFAFGGAEFNLGFSQGPKLHQTYGGGIGVVVPKTAKERDGKI